MKKHERLAGLLLIAVGIVAAVHSYLNLKLGAIRHPDSGFMPFWASVLLVVFSAAWVFQSWGPDERPAPFWGKGEWTRPLLSCAMMVLYGLTLERIGYVTSTLVFLLAWQFLVEREKWRKATLISVVATAAMYVMFVKLLGVPLPTGFIGL